jgi:hypothetical protein
METMRVRGGRAEQAEVLIGSTVVERCCALGDPSIVSQIPQHPRASLCPLGKHALYDMASADISNVPLKIGSCGGVTASGDAQRIWACSPVCRHHCTLVGSAVPSLTQTLTCYQRVQS